jgi:hypothetical protein
MRYTMLGLLVFAAACSRQPVSPTMPSAIPSVAESQATAQKGGPNVEVTFTKWIDPILGFPSFTGVAGEGPTGTFAATVLSRDAFENGNIVKLEARYEVIDDGAGHAFVALIEGTQNNQTLKAVLNGTIIEGSLEGARVHATFDVIRPCPEFGQSACFTGVIRVMAGSAK